MRFAAVTSAVLALLAVSTGTTGAATSAQTALQGISKAAAAGRISPADAAADRATVLRAASLWQRLPGSRGAALKSVLDDVAAVSASYNGPRAFALFGMLKENADYLATHPLEGRTHQDIADGDGVIYRYFPGHGFVFHPLGNFGALNAAVASGDQDRTRRLADALLARGVSNRRRRSRLGRYWFTLGEQPWRSGWRRRSRDAGIPARVGAARGPHARDGGHAGIPRDPAGGLVRALAAGPWIRLYSFSSLVVLNAQLQAVLSLRDYATRSGNADAGDLATRMGAAAASALGQFDTGYWSYYALPRDDSPLDYHLYVVSLLKRLGGQDKRFSAAATRFLAYTKQPPAFKLADSGGSGVFFWLSKPGRVAVTVGASSRTLALGDGWHRVSWSTGRRAGLFAVQLAATDYSGNKASASALPLVHAALAGRAPASASAAAAPGQTTSFVVGAGLDSPAQAQKASSLGLGAIRLTVPWLPGQTAPDPATVAALASAPAARLAVELSVAAVPDDAGRAQLVAFGAALVQQVFALHDLIVSAPASDAATLGGLRDAVRAVNETTLVAGTIADVSALTELGASFKASGRTQPIMDELAYTSPTLPDYTSLVGALGASFDGTAQPGSALPVLYDKVGTTTKVPPAKAALYSPEAVSAAGADEATQGAAYAAALRATACEPTVAGILFDRLADGAPLGAQDGLLYPDLSQKQGVAGLKPLFVSTQRRGVVSVCPGLAVPAAPSVLVFPPQTSVPAGTSAWSVQLGCVRDCLYLVTLERIRDGAPMLARRGALGAGAPATVKLPALHVPAGVYRLAVRLVGQVNPGALFVQESEPIRSARREPVRSGASLLLSARASDTPA